MAKKRKTLPKDFSDLLKKGDLQELIQVFDKCEIEARGGYAKQTAIAFDECPHELAKWLIEHGADIESADTYGYTPLQSRAGSWNGNIRSLLELGADVHASGRQGTALHHAVERHQTENVKLLLQYGAKVDTLATYGYGSGNNEYTPLELNLFSCNNIDIENAVEISRLLLDAGAQKTERMKEFVAKIGERFEFYRPDFNVDYVDETDQALQELYAIFDVEPAAKRLIHDGKSTISVKAKTWQKQHEELWDLLVPGKGAAQTMQGEVIRISGKIARELKDNGGINWDEDFKLMADAFLEFLKQGNTLSADEINEAAKIVSEVKRRNDTNLYRLSELGVKWAVGNPTPIEAPEISYTR